MYCDTIPTKPTSQSQYNQCIATQNSHLPLQPQSQYNFCIETHLSHSHQAFSVTIQLGVLQYNGSTNKPPCCNTIFGHCTPMLQYNFSYCNTLPLAKTALQNYHVTIQCLYCDTVPMFKWAVAHSIPAPYFLFFRFSLLLLFFQLFPATGKYKKYIYLYIFFHFSKHSNKFIKNYFIQFSSVLHPVKP